MRFHEWRKAGGTFKLVGGPEDGKEVTPGTMHNGWPNDLAVRGSHYTMRIGDLDHYDYVAAFRPEGRDALDNERMGR
jgi:hypothetical protein